MRQLKFRAWSEYNNKFYTPILGPNGKSLDVSYIEIQGENDDPVSEWTGLKDLNGIDIWEGDIIILKYGPPGVWVVEWGKNHTGFFPFTRCDFSNYECEWVSPGDAEIIGNIYENPELLESK